MHCACSCRGGSFTFGSAHSILVSCFCVGSLLQFCASVLAHASVLAVAFGFSPLLHCRSFFMRSLLRGVIGGMAAPLRFRAPGVARHFWFAHGRWAPLQSLGTCGVVGLLYSRLPLLVLLYRAVFCEFMLLCVCLFGALWWRACMCSYAVACVVGLVFASLYVPFRFLSVVPSLPCASFLCISL